MRKILLSGGRPTGYLHLGHYTGAFENYVNIQDAYDNYFIVSDIHMLTTSATKSSIENICNNTRNMVIDAIAMGVDPNKTKFYLQSNIPEMPYIYTLLQNFTIKSRVENITSLSEMKRHSDIDKISLGLLAYPVMEAADIISMGADFVTVGRDNIDHINICNEIIESLNTRFKCSIPSTKYITGANNFIVGTDGKNKMSKSLDNCIYIRDSYETMVEKVKSMKWRHYTEGFPNVVIEYLKIFDIKSFEDENIFTRYKEGNISEKEGKEILINVLYSILSKMQSRVLQFKDDFNAIDNIIQDGTEQARERASKTLKVLKDYLGYDRSFCINKI